MSTTNATLDIIGSDIDICLLVDVSPTWCEAYEYLSPIFAGIQYHSSVQQYLYSVS